MGIGRSKRQVDLKTILFVFVVVGVLVLNVLVWVRTTHYSSPSPPLSPSSSQVLTQEEEPGYHREGDISREPRHNLDRQQQHREHILSVEEIHDTAHGHKETEAGGQEEGDFKNGETAHEGGKGGEEESSELLQHHHEKKKKKHHGKSSHDNKAHHHKKMKASGGVKHDGDQRRHHDDNAQHEDGDEEHGTKHENGGHRGKQLHGHKSSGDHHNLSKKKKKGKKEDPSGSNKHKLEEVANEHRPTVQKAVEHAESGTVNSPIVNYEVEQGPFAPGEAEDESKWPLVGEVPRRVRKDGKVGIPGKNDEAEVAVPPESNKWIGKRKPRVRIFTEYGSILWQLEPGHAPKTVENFIKNCKGPKGYMNTSSACFYRYERAFVLQGGACGGNRGKTVPLEYSMPNEKNTVALARAGGDLNSGGSEWFINLANNTRGLGPGRKGGYAVFAKVLSGEDTMKRMKQLPVIKGGLTKFAKPIPKILKVELYHATPEEE